MVPDITTVASLSPIDESLFRTRPRPQENETDVRAGVCRQPGPSSGAGNLLQGGTVTQRWKPNAL